MAERSDLAEPARLAEARDKGVPWRKWGPYLSERQWGTVREDYSDDGDAWELLHATTRRARAPTTGARTAWPASPTTSSGSASRSRSGTGSDPILKERLFGLTNAEGNHGEDVKEYYFYLDCDADALLHEVALQVSAARPIPYDDLVDDEPRPLARTSSEYELLDTGVFDDDRYFDVFVEYAKAAPEDVLIRITRGQPRTGAGARCTCCPRSGSATPGRGGPTRRSPSLRRGARRRTAARVVAAAHAELGERWLYVRGRRAAALHRERDQQRAALRRRRTPSPYVKDGINDYVVHGRRDAVNPDGTGTKAAAHHRRRRVGAGEAGRAAAAADATRRRTPSSDPFARLRRDVRRAPARGRRVLPRRSRPRLGDARTRRGSCGRRSPGCCGRKQYYFFDVDKWLGEHGVDPLRRRAAARAQPRVVPHGQRRRHLDARQVGVPVVRGLGPGVPRHRARRRSTSTSPSSSST